MKKCVVIAASDRGRSLYKSGGNAWEVGERLGQVEELPHEGCGLSFDNVGQSSDLAIF